MLELIPQLCQQPGSHGSREDGRNLCCMFLVTICFRKQERKQRAFAAPSVSASHAAQVGLQPAAAIASR